MTHFLVHFTQKIYKSNLASSGPFGFVYSFWKYQEKSKLVKLMYNDTNQIKQIQSPLAWYAATEIRRKIRY